MYFQFVSKIPGKVGLSDSSVATHLSDTSKTTVMIAALFCLFVFVVVFLCCFFVFCLVFSRFLLSFIYLFVYLFICFLLFILHNFCIGVF